VMEEGQVDGTGMVDGRVVMQGVASMIGGVRENVGEVWERVGEIEQWAEQVNEWAKGVEERLAGVEPDSKLRAAVAAVEAGVTVKDLVAAKKIAKGKEEDKMEETEGGGSE